MLESRSYTKMLAVGLTASERASADRLFPTCSV
jgi:hypothetical protein